MMYECNILPEETDPVILGLNNNSIITKNLNDS